MRRTPKSNNIYKINIKGNKGTNKKTKKGKVLSFESIKNGTQIENQKRKWEKKEEAYIN